MSCLYIANRIFFGITIIVMATSCSSSAGSTREHTGVVTDEYGNRIAVTSALSELHERRMRDYFVRGSTKQMLGEYAEAILEFQQALRFRDSADIHLVIAESYVELGKLDQAFEHTQSALERSPDMKEARALAGRLYLARMQVEKAVSIYEDLVRDHPSLHYRYLLGQLYEISDPAKAESYYTEWLDTNEDYNILLRLWELYSNSRDIEGLARVLERLHFNWPDEPNIPQALMEAYIQQNEIAKGYKLLESLEYSAPASEVFFYYVSYGNALIDQIDSSFEARDFAQKFLQKTQETQLDQWQPQLIGGILASNLEDTTNSARFFTRALLLADTIPAVPLQICAHYFQEERYGAVVALMRQYAPVYDADPRFPFFLGLGLTRLDSNLAAIDALKRCVDLDSANVDAWAQLGILYSVEDFDEESDLAYNRALVLDPTNPLVNNNYAYALSERGIELEKAMEMTELALRAEPNNPSYLDTMGWIYFQMGEYSKALDYINQAILNGDASATVFEHLGDAHEKLGNIEEAVEAWQTALEKEPERESLLLRLRSVRSVNSDAE